jgi:hypothetical protein
MANEAVLKHKASTPIDFIVADGAGIEKGTICKLADPRTASASSAADVFAGVARREKIASDGRTRLSMFVGPGDVFDMKAAATTITAGSLVSLSGANLIKTATEAEVVTGAAFGKALETAAASETIEVMLI